MTLPGLDDPKRNCLHCGEPLTFGRPDWCRECDTALEALVRVAEEQRQREEVRARVRAWKHGKVVQS